MTGTKQSEDKITLEFSKAQVRLLQSLVRVFEYKGTPYEDSVGSPTIKSKTHGVANITLQRQLAKQLESALPEDPEISRSSGKPKIKQARTSRPS